MIAILTNSPIKQVLTKPKKSGRVAKWAIELGEHDIVFQAEGDNNKETPTNFLIEAPPKDNRKEVRRKMDVKLEETRPSYEWKLYTDGASRSDGSGVGLMLIDPGSKEYTYALRFEFETTNNEVEYEALLGIYAAKQPAIKEYLQRTKETLRRFRSYTIEHIRRNQNKKADALRKLASMTFEHLTKEVLVEVLARRSIEEKEVLQVETKEEESWMTPIHKYLLSSLLPEDSKESRKTRIKAPQYKLIRDCEKYKEKSAARKRAEIKAIATRNALSFSHWKVSILGPLPTALGGLKFLAIAIEHSTKWIEGKPLTTVNARHIERFVWEYVVCRFGVPQIISSKDDKQFKEGIFVDLCIGLKITRSFSLITEHIEIISRIEKQLTRNQQGWVEDLPQVLWIHRTLPRKNQKETPFSLTYDPKAIIKTVKSNVAKDDRGRTKEVTKRKDSKEVALIEESYYQNKLRRPRMSLRLMKRIKESDLKSSESSNMIGDYIPHGNLPSGLA
ncbi:reverse transcriptase domain-containing protein [Tanacetum coccineum]